VGTDKPPLTVKAGAGTATNLSADKLDGQDSTSFSLSGHDHDSRYFTKTESDARYLNKTATAADSAKLGGQPPSSYPRKCEDTTVYGRAEITGSSATSTLSTTGVNGDTDFVCNGENVQVKRTGVGSYEVVFGDVEHFGQIGLGTGNGPLPVVSSRESGKVVSASGPFQCAFTPPPYVICFPVEIRDSSGAAVDGNFNIAIM
jgi:hypothetical protein